MWIKAVHSGIAKVTQVYFFIFCHYFYSYFLFNFFNLFYNLNEEVSCSFPFQLVFPGEIFSIVFV